MKSGDIWSKKKTRWRLIKCQTQGFEKIVYTPMGDVTVGGNCLYSKMNWNKISFRCIVVNWESPWGYIGAKGFLLTLLC